LSFNFTQLPGSRKIRAKSEVDFISRDRKKSRRIENFFADFDCETFVDFVDEFLRILRMNFVKVFQMVNLEFFCKNI
jgi:hypothetical protein